MEFTSQTRMTNKTVVAAGNNNKIHQIQAGSITGLDIGHAIVLTKAGLQGRWDGATVPAEPYRLAIVTKKQLDGDASVSALVIGNYVREHVVLDDDSALPAESEFVMTVSDLWAEGEW